MNDLKKAIEDVRYLQPMINSFLTMGEQDSLNTVIEAAEKSETQLKEPDAEGQREEVCQCKAPIVRYNTVAGWGIEEYCGACGKDLE